MIAWCLLSLLAAPAPAPAQAPTGSIALLVEGTAGTAELSTVLEAHLGSSGVAVRPSAEARAAVGFLGLEAPLTDEACRALRSELAVERLLVLSTRATAQGIAVQLRVASASSVERRFVLSPAERLSERAAELVDAALATEPAKAGRAGVVGGVPGGVIGASPAEAGPPMWRMISLSPPALDETLLGTEIQVRQKAKGTFHAGVVLVVSGSSLVLAGESGVTTELAIADLDQFIVLRPGRPLVAVGDEIALVSRKGGRIEGKVLEVLGDAVDLDFKNGTAGRVTWSQVATLEVRSRHVDPVDVVSIGITPRAIFRPNPAYPMSLRDAGATGKVVLQILVDKQGRVESIEVVSGDHDAFVASALAAVKKWRYEPVFVAGEPIVWKSKVTLRFRLR